MGYIGYIAGFLTIISLLPQIVKIYDNKSANDVSVLMVIIMLCSAILWMICGFDLNSIPMIITNFLLSVINAILLIIIFIYRKAK